MALSAEQTALQESKASARRELSTWQEQETALAKDILKEEESLQALQNEQARLAERTSDLERQQVWNQQTNQFPEHLGSRFIMMHHRPDLVRLASNLMFECTHPVQAKFETIHQ